MKTSVMKWKEIPKTTTITGLILYVPKRYQLDQGIPHERMYVFSGWYRGLWLKADPYSERIYPLTVDPKWKEVENWKVKLPYPIEVKPKKKKAKK